MGNTLNLKYTVLHYRTISNISKGEKSVAYIYLNIPKAQRFKR